jgi:hypothetical protein
MKVGASMSKINFHPNDKVLTFFEIMKKMMMITAILSIFLVLFFIPMATGTFEGVVCGGDQDGNIGDGNMQYCGEASDDPITKIVGIGGVGCFSLILLALWSQVFRVIIGQGKIVISPDNEMILRTSKPIKSHFKPSGSSFTPLTQVAKDDSDNDEDIEVEESSDWWMSNEED